MARIRSQHPGQWTDEDFVEMSIMARLLCLGIRNEADDYGCFEWKPKRLKMRLLPADSCDVDELLSEMEQCNQIKSYEVDGKKYGAIRNFCKYQRPKKPNSFCPLNPELNEYIGLDTEEVEIVSEPVPDKGGSASEITQAEGRKVGRKEGRKVIKEKSNKKEISLFDGKSVDDHFEEFWKKYPSGPPGRKGSKEKTKQAYLKAIAQKGSPEPGSMTRQAVAYGHYREHTPEYVKGCIAWLNADGHLEHWKGQDQGGQRDNGFSEALNKIQERIEEGVVA